MRLILKACFIYFYFISNAIIFLVCFPSVTLNSLRLFIFFFPLHSLVFSFLTDVPRSSFHFLLIPLLLFFSICLHQSSCFHSLDHLAFLALFFFPSPSASLLPPSPPPPQSSSLHFCLFVFCLVCFLKCPPIPSPSSSIPSRSPPSPALSPALIFFSPLPIHHVHPVFRLVPPVPCLLKHQRSQRAVEPPADSTHNSPLLIMRTTGARGAEFKHWKQQLKEVYESVLVKRWKRDCGVWCCRQLSVFFWYKSF